MMRPQKVPFWAAFIGTGFGTGFCPVAPGTAGALLALLIWLGVDLLCPGGTVWWTTLFLLLFSIAAGVWAAGVLERYWGEDPSRVTIDELAGTWMALLAVPSGKVWGAIAAFALFRFFDIYKPLGIRKMENFKGGWGILMDDLLAGGYSFILIIIGLCVIH